MRGSPSSTWGSTSSTQGSPTFIWGSPVLYAELTTILNTDSKPSTWCSSSSKRAHSSQHICRAHCPLCRDHCPVSITWTCFLAGLTMHSHCGCQHHVQLIRNLHSILQFAAGENSTSYLVQPQTV